MPKQNRQKSLSNKELKRYKRLTDSLLKTNNLYTIRSLIHSFLREGNRYPSYSAKSDDGSRLLGDCNGDGSIDILDVVQLVNIILR